MSSKGDMERKTRRCSCVSKSRTNRQHQVKQLRNHRKRIQMRGEGRRNRQTESYYCHCCYEMSKDSKKCCPCGGHSKKDEILKKFVPFTQEHSIITDSRLIGHHGLFNHEIKSFDIERLLGEGVKLERAGKKGQEKSHSLLYQSTASCISSPFSSNDLFVHNAVEVLSPERKATSSLYSIVDGQDNKREARHKSDLMTSPQPYPSNESFESSLLTKHSISKVAVTLNKANSVTQEKEKESLPCGVTHRTPKSRELPAQQTLSSGLNLRRPSLDPGLRGECLASVSFVTTMAAQLCDSVHFANLNRTDLQAESWSVLLRVLKEKHGNQLHENLLSIQNQLSYTFGADVTEPGNYNSLKSVIRDDDVVSAEASTLLFAKPTGYDNQEKEEIIGRNFDLWKSLQPHPQEMAPEQPTTPADSSTSLLHDILRPTCYTPLCGFSEPSGKSARDHLFAPLPPSSWGGTASQFQHWENSFNGLDQQTKVSPLCGSLENSSMNPSTEVGPRSHLLKDKRIQQFPFSPLQLAERQFIQAPAPFKSDKYTFSSSLCNQVHDPYLSSHFQTGTHLSDPVLSSSHSDITPYPSSYLLNITSPLYPLHSPEHWSFPPMKLY